MMFHLIEWPQETGSSGRCGYPTSSKNFTRTEASYCYHNMPHTRQYAWMCSDFIPEPVIPASGNATG
eukprot:2431218-Prymnesium_polylepis.1